jgi:dTDP-4-dehydrorhamnose 3,5-epimerase
MASLASRGVKPSVVNDQVGRLSFTADIAAGIDHLLRTGAPYGTYNLTNDGAPQSWAEVAADVYELVGGRRDDVTGVSTEEYFKGKDAAPRPLNSVLDLSKITGTGFKPAGSISRLAEYLGR